MANKSANSLLGEQMNNVYVYVDGARTFTAVLHTTHYPYWQCVKVRDLFSKRTIRSMRWITQKYSWKESSPTQNNFMNFSSAGVKALLQYSIRTDYKFRIFFPVSLFTDKWVLSMNLCLFNKKRRRTHIACLTKTLLTFQKETVLMWFQKKMDVFNTKKGV